MKKKRVKPDAGKSARRVARNVIGIVPSTKVIVPKAQRKPKHKLEAERVERGE